jgi:inorganic pyrophosphatase
MIIDVTIEIPSHADPVKYEVDDSTGQLYLDRFLNTAMYYPCNYGFVSTTLADDGDPLDVLVISPYPLLSGCIARCKVLGVLKMKDDEGIDNKILVVPDDVMYNGYKDLVDVSTRLLDQIQHFFTHYKDLDVSKWSEVQGWGSAKEAEILIDESYLNYDSK